LENNFFGRSVVQQNQKCCTTGQQGKQHLMLQPTHHAINADAYIRCEFKQTNFFIEFLAVTLVVPLTTSDFLHDHEKYW
jgi:hypothetical protein